jgi:hypothetical protein
MLWNVSNLSLFVVVIFGSLPFLEDVRIEDIKLIPNTPKPSK